MANKDQRLRHCAEKSNDWSRVKREDRKHANELKKIISKYGWPTIFLVGKKASMCAWLIAQHADHDLVFQKKCLKLMEHELLKNPLSVAKQNIAYLKDRILVHLGRKQLFGTQFKRLKDGHLELSPLANKKDVDKRRKRFGMELLEEYMQMATRIKN